MKYYIKLTDGSYIQEFTPRGYVFTKDIKFARQYTKSIANKRALKLNLSIELTSKS